MKITKELVQIKKTQAKDNHQTNSKVFIDDIGEGGA